VFACCLLASLARSEPRHAITLYDEPAKYPPGFQHFDFVDPQAPKGGSLRRMESGSFDTLNPFANRGTPISMTQAALIYETLGFQSLDEPFTEYGYLARYIEKAPDNSWVRFHIDPRARFSDGVAVTAEDVKFSFDSLVEQGSPFWRAYYKEVREPVVEDRLRIRFDFRHAGNRELPLVLAQLYVLPRHWWQGRDFNRSSMQPPLGSGPYRLEKAEAGRSVSYRRNPDWWARDLPVGRGLYNFERIRFDYYRDSGVALQAFKAGQADINVETSVKAWSSGYDSPALRDGRLRQESFPYPYPASLQGLVFNLRRPLFEDRRVRQALSLLFDFEWTNRALFSNSYLRSRSYYPNSEFAASGVPEGQEWLYLSPYRKQLPAQLFKQPFSLPTTEGRGIPRETLRHALGLLADAGWKLSGDRLLNKKGEPLRFEILLVNPSLERILQPYRENLASIGIDARLRTVDRAQYKQRLDQFDYDMILMTLPQTLSPGLEQWQYFHSSQVKVKGSKNYAGIANPVVDAMLNRLLGAHSRDEQVAAARALDRTLLWQYYSIPNWYLNSHRLAYRNRFAFVATPPYTLGLRAWWQKNLETSR
ncbi:MAG: extracellular solute-binding protein, partial [Pseudomonas aeruginosa]|nr:extracellular solute-binding protein [Pseudomonas aeruginosa]